MYVVADGRQYQIPREGSLLFGSAANCDIQLPADAKIHPKHARIRFLGARLLVELLEDGVIELHGGSAARMRWIEPGDCFRFSPDGVEFSICELATEMSGPTSDTVSSSDDTSTSQAATKSGEASPLLTKPERTRGAYERPLQLIAVAFTLIAIAIIVASVWPSDSDPVPVPDPPGDVIHDPGDEDVETEEVFTVTEEQARQGTVLIGFEIDGEYFALCTGWAASFNQVVTSATEVAALQSSFADHQDSIFVVHAADTSEVYRINKMQTHPLWDASNPENTQSIQNDIGLLTLKSQLPTALDEYSTEELPLVGLHFSPVPLRSEIEIVSLDAPIDIEIVAGVGATTENARFGHPILRIELDAQFSVQGSPVWLSDRVVGTVSRSVNGRVVVVPNDRLAALLESE